MFEVAVMFQSSVTAKIRAGWQNFSEIISQVLRERVLSLKLKGLVFLFGTKFKTRVYEA